MEEQNRSNERLTDKAFSRLMISSLLGVFMCIVCLCSASWAWFSADASNHKNTLVTGKFGLDVAVVDESERAVSVTKNADGSSLCYFSDAGVYTVTLAMSQDTTVNKGFCVFKTATESYRTASINVEGSNPFTFTLCIAEDNVSVVFSPAWGLPAEASVEQNGEMTLLLRADASQE